MASEAAIAYSLLNPEARKSTDHKDGLESGGKKRADLVHAKPALCHPYGMEGQSRFPAVMIDATRATPGTHYCLMTNGR